MVEIRPMGEDHILPRCLHDGPIDAAAGQPAECDELELPSHPWTEETIRGLVAERPDFGLCDAGGGFPAEFMREMIQRYGSCALLAWEGQKVVGFIRFYPMQIARLVSEYRANRPEGILDCTLACAPEEDPGTLWVQCVMTSRPYTGWAGPALPSGKPHWWPATASEAGARKGAGLSLARAVVPWAREHGWKRVVKVAHCDLDFFYGQWGGGGKSFWEKAGFRAIGTIYRPEEWSDSDDMTVLRSQAADKGMTEQDVWTLHRMACEL
jgi:hypothetical protein